MRNAPGLEVNWGYLDRRLFVPGITDLTDALRGVVEVMCVSLASVHPVGSAVMEF